MIRKLFSIALIAVTTATTMLAATLWVGSHTLEYEKGGCISYLGTGWRLNYLLDDDHLVAVVGEKGGLRVFGNWRLVAGDKPAPSDNFTGWGKSFGGFVVGSFGTEDIGFSQVRVPFWFLVIALGTYPALAFIRGPLRRRRRRRNGRCLSCGYDLQGNVSGMCPECGSTTDGE